MPRIAVGGIIAVLAGACCPEPALAPPLPPPLPASVAEPDPTRARLVLAVVIDQLPSWALDRYLPHLSPNGLIRKLVDDGVYVERVAYAYANTNTAPGHAAIFTGAPPSVSGVSGNEVIDDERGAIDFVDDGKHAVYGNPKDFASPEGLRVPTIGDALEAQRGEAAQVVALSAKDRAAILSGGRGADLALWYDDAIPGFSTSSYYGPLPTWLTGWLDAHPVSQLLSPWEPFDRSILAQVAGDDDAPGEGDLEGFGTTFPHDPSASKKPYLVLGMLPQQSEYLVELAGVVAEKLDLGGDAIPDLLIVSISGTDYVGHTFGPESWEYLDHLYRADRALGALYHTLSKRAPTAVLLTSDHGVQPLPEKAGDERRVFPEEVEKAAQKAAEEVVGEGIWIAGYHKPLVFFTKALRSHARRDEAVAAITSAISSLWGIAWVHDIAQTVAEGDAPRRMVSLSLAGDGDLYVLVKEGVVVDENRPRGRGTTHGTPYPRDREVPVLFDGPTIATARIGETLAQDRVAPTLAALLGIEPPSQVTAAPLPQKDGNAP